jgi:hypothetical protein
MFRALMAMMVLVGMAIAVVLTLPFVLVFIVQLALFPLRIVFALLFLPFLFLKLVFKLLLLPFAIVGSVLAAVGGLIGLTLAAVPFIPLLCLAFVVWAVMRMASRPAAGSV